MIYTFADCVLDTQRYILYRAGRRIRLRPKVFQVLMYLLTHWDRVVPKQALCEQVWRLCRTVWQACRTLASSWVWYYSS